MIDTQTKLYLVLELGDGGDMYDYIMKHEGGLGEEMARKYFRQIVTAIQYCHKLHVVHRDLKPENVVFFEKLGMVKLTDFGFSNKFNPGAKLLTSCGSLAYSAPEILLGDAYDAPAVGNKDYNIIDGASIAVSEVSHYDPIYCDIFIPLYHVNIRHFCRVDKKYLAIYLFCVRYLEPGCDTVHVGLRLRSISGGQ